MHIPPTEAAILATVITYVCNFTRQLAEGDIKMSVPGVGRYVVLTSKVLEVSVAVEV